MRALAARFRPDSGINASVVGAGMCACVHTSVHTCAHGTCDRAHPSSAPALAAEGHPGSRWLMAASSRAQSKKGCRREQWICRRIPKESIVSTGQETDFCFFPAASPWAAHPTPQR